MTTDDELIEAMLVAMYDDGCPGAVDSMRAVLAVVRAHDRDGARWRWAKANLYKFHQITGGAHSDIRESAIDARVDAAMRAEMSEFEHDETDEQRAARECYEDAINEGKAIGAEEAAAELAPLRAELATLRAERDGILAAYKAYMAENRPSRQLYEQHTTELRERAEKAEAGRDDALVAVKAMHKLLDRDWAIVDRDITLRCELHDQAWNYLHEMRDLVRAALENVVPYKEPQP